MNIQTYLRTYSVVYILCDHKSTHGVFLLYLSSSSRAYAEGTAWATFQPQFRGWSSHYCCV